MYNNNSLLGYAIGDDPPGKGTIKYSTKNNINNEILYNASKSNFAPFELQTKEKRRLDTEKVNDDMSNFKWQYNDPNGIYNMIRKSLVKNKRDKTFSSNISGQSLMEGENPVNYLIGRMPEENKINIMQKDYANLSFKDKLDTNPGEDYLKNNSDYGWAQYVMPDKNIFPLETNPEVVQYLRNGFRNITTTPNESTGKDDLNDIRTYMVKDDKNTGRMYKPLVFLRDTLNDYITDETGNYKIGGNTLMGISKDPRFTYEQGYGAGDYTRYLQFDDKGDIQKYGGLDEYNFDDDFLDKYFGEMEIPGIGKVKDVGGSKLAGGLLSLVGGLGEAIGVDVPYVSEKRKVSKLLQTGGKPYTMHIQGPTWQELQKLYNSNQLNEEESMIYSQINEKRIKAFEKFMKQKTKKK